MALAVGLKRHATGDDKLSDWWWQNYQQSWDWLTAASRVGALTNPKAEQTTRLAELLAAATSETEWATCLLAEGGYLGTSDVVLQVVKSEVNDGAGEVAAPPTNGSAVAHLLTAASYAGLRPVKTGSDGDSSRTRIRNQNNKVVLTEMVESARKLKVHPRSDATEQNWLDRLIEIEQTWGDGWVLRQAVAGVPLAIALDTIAASVVGDHPKLASTLRAESEGRKNRGNADWWRDTLNDADSDLVSRHWAFSVLASAHSPVVVNLANELNSLVESLSAKHYRTLRAAIQATSKLSVGRVLVIRDPLRLKQVTFSPRVLWLARAVASEGSIEQIDKKLPIDINGLLVPGMGDMRELVRIVGSRTKKIPLAQFRGGRASLPPGGWASHVKLGSITKAIADEMLTNPGEWPADLVLQASGSVEARLSKQLAPLGPIAEANRWFD